MSLILAPTACVTGPGGISNSSVYHCVSTAVPVPGANQRAAVIPLEELRYGSFVEHDRPTVGHASHCADMPVPSSAYLRYRLNGQAVEKRFDLSGLTASRVSRGPEGGLRTVEFYVDGAVAELRLVTIVPGHNPRIETLDRQ